MSAGACTGAGTAGGEARRVVDGVRERWTSTASTRPSATAAAVASGQLQRGCRIARSSAEERAAPEAEPETGAGADSLGRNMRPVASLVMTVDGGASEISPSPRASSSACPSYELFTRPSTMMVLGDARQSLPALVHAVKGDHRLAA